MTTYMPTTRNADALRVALMAAQRAERFGARMRERRTELELSQSEVADRIPVPSVNKDYISRWELGKVEPSDAYVEHIAEALDTTVGDLMAGPVADRIEKPPTPDLLGMNGSNPNRIDQLDERLEKLTEIVELLAATTAELVAASAPQETPGKPQAAPRKSGAKRTPRAKR